jgi:hypothetical protein
MRDAPLIGVDSTRIERELVQKLTLDMYVVRGLAHRIGSPISVDAESERLVV